MNLDLMNLLAGVGAYVIVRSTVLGIRSLFRKEEKMPDRATQTLLEMQALNQVWRYLNRPESAAGLMRRLGRDRLPRIKAHIKQRLDECAAHLIVLFPDQSAESLDDEEPSGERLLNTAFPLTPPPLQPTVPVPQDAGTEETQLRYVTTHPVTVTAPQRPERLPVPEAPLRIVPVSQRHRAARSDDEFGEDQ